MISRSVRIALLIGAGLLSAACDRVLGLRLERPGRVQDFQVTGVTPSTASIQWTQVSDGAHRPASYLVVYATDAIEWDSVPETRMVIEGDSVGQPLIFTLEELSRGTAYFIGIVAFRGQLDSLPVFGEPSEPVELITDADEPASVQDLTATIMSSTSVTLRWTQAEDGVGGAANYLLANGTPSLDWNADRPTAQVVFGSSEGTFLTRTIEGLSSSTDYEFQLASIRGIPSDTSQLAALSNLVAAQTSAPAATTPFFTDNFDTGARLNANGFGWLSTGSRVAVATDKAFSGTHSLRFRFGPDTVGGDSSAEQRFSLGRNLTELWIEYMLFLPANYEHRNDVGPDNNKFFRIWGDDYAARNKIGMSTRPFGPGETKSRLLYEYIPTALTTFVEAGSSEFAGTVMRETWTRVRIHVRYVSAIGAADGLIQIWFGNTLVGDWGSIDMKYVPEIPHWNSGYLFGYANSGFALETYFHVDDVKFYSANPGW